MAETKQILLPHGERRDYDRIQDAVALKIDRLQDLSAAGELVTSAASRTKVRKANKYDIEGYADVKRDYPAVADYVDALEERIRQLLLGGEVSPESPTHKVSLSASGMAFADNRLMYPGEQIGLTITLFPSLTKINCDARIVSSGDAPEISGGERHTYRINFIRISDANRTALDKHVQSLVRAIPSEVD